MADIIWTFYDGCLSVSVLDFVLSGCLLNLPTWDSLLFDSPDSLVTCVYITLIWVVLLLFFLLLFGGSFYQPVHSAYGTSTVIVQCLFSFHFLLWSRLKELFVILSKYVQALCVL